MNVAEQVIPCARVLGDLGRAEDRFKHLHVVFVAFVEVMEEYGVVAAFKSINREACELDYIVEGSFDFVEVVRMRFYVWEIIVASSWFPARPFC